MCVSQHALWWLRFLDLGTKCPVLPLLLKGTCDENNHRDPNENAHTHFSADVLKTLMGDGLVSDPSRLKLCFTG